MKYILKLVTPLLVFAILFTSCAVKNNSNTLEQIETYLAKNEFNKCLQFVKELENDEKSTINNDVCNVVINNFIELRDKTKIDKTNIFDLSLIDTTFTENCQKLWNIISEFKIDNEYELYNECVNLRYYSEMIDYTRYCDIYTLIKQVNILGYLDDLSTALYEYENNGNNSIFMSVSKEIKDINYDSFDPQQYLVSDFKVSYEKIVVALNNLNESFIANDYSSVATGINTIKKAMTDILYITDTLSAVNAIQKSIYNKISTENIYAPFDSEIQVTKREYTTGMSFALDMIFGEIENVTEETTETTTQEVTKESTTKSKPEIIPLDDAVEIAVNSINKTKTYNGNVDITLTQTENVQLTKFESNSSIADVNNLIESQIKQSLKKTNGTNKNNYTFSNGTSGDKTLDSFVPPENKKATLNTDAISSYNCIEGSGGYIITLILKQELIEYGNMPSNIGSIINTFKINNSDDITDFETSYSKTNIKIFVNNDGRLMKMEYAINGISNCVFAEKDTKNKYQTQFNFKNEYKYEFKY